MATSPSPATNPVRERLARPALVVGLGLGIVLTLALLFDPQSFLKRMTHSHTPSVDIYFLRAVAHNPHTTAFWLLLAKREIQTGHYTAALQILRPMFVASLPAPYETRARWLYYSDLLAIAYSYPEGSPQRLQDEHTLGVLISQLRTNARGSALKGLAREAIALHEEKTAVAIYEDLAIQNSGQRATFYALAGAAALGLGHPREAARLYFTAQASAATVPEQTRYFLTALRILQSHNDVVLAISEAQHHLGNLGAQASVLRYLVTLARAANKPYIAAHYAKLLVRMP